MLTVRSGIWRRRADGQSGHEHARQTATSHAEQQPTKAPAKRRQRTGAATPTRDEIDRLSAQASRPERWEPPVQALAAVGARGRGREDGSPAFTLAPVTACL